MKVGPQNDAEITALATRDIEGILGPAEHPDVQAVLDTIRCALACQRRLIVRDLEAEARRGIWAAPTNQQLTYRGGLRRAARIARGGAR